MESCGLPRANVLAIDDQHVSFEQVAGDHREGVAGASRLLLVDDLAALSQVLGNLRLGGVEDRDRAGHAGFAAGVDDEVDHRFRAHAVEDLRPAGAESGAEAGG